MESGYTSTTLYSVVSISCYDNKLIQGCTKLHKYVKYALSEYCTAVVAWCSALHARMLSTLSSLNHSITTPVTCLLILRLPGPRNLKGTHVCEQRNGISIRPEVNQQLTIPFMMFFDAKWPKLGVLRNIYTYRRNQLHKSLSTNSLKISDFEMLLLC